MVWLMGFLDPEANVDRYHALHQYYRHRTMMKAYYRKEESKRAGKVSWHVFRDAKRCAGLLKYLKKNGYR